MTTILRQRFVYRRQCRRISHKFLHSKNCQQTVVGIIGLQYLFQMTEVCFIPTRGGLKMQYQQTRDLDDDMFTGL